MSYYFFISKEIENLSCVSTPLSSPGKVSKVIFSFWQTKEKTRWMEGRHLWRGWSGGQRGQEDYPDVR